MMNSLLTFFFRIFVTFSMASLVGCVSSTAEKLEEFPAANGLIMLHAGYVPVVLGKNDSVCFGNQPDALMNINASGSVSNFSLGETESEQVLGGRNPNVLIVRDLLFHSCLAESRLGLNKSEGLELFNTTLQLIDSINQSSLEAAHRTED